MANWRRYSRVPWERYPAAARSRRWRRHQQSRGGAFVELALILPLLSLMAFGTFDIGSLVPRQTTADAIMRAGLRVAVLDGHANIASVVSAQSSLYPASAWGPLATGSSLQKETGDEASTTGTTNPPCQSTAATDFFVKYPTATACFSVGWCDYANCNSPNGVTWGDDVPSTNTSAYVAVRVTLKLQPLTTTVTASPIYSTATGFMPQEYSAGAGTGTMTVLPTSATSGTTQEFDFTYRADFGSAFESGMVNGTITMAVPSPWTSSASSTPQTSDPTAPAYTDSTCGTLSYSAGLITISHVNLDNGGYCYIKYGDTRLGGGVVVPTVSSSLVTTWTTSEASNAVDIGGLTALATGSPTITINPPGGSPPPPGVSPVPSPNQGAGNNQLHAVSCISSAFCMAVGWYGASPAPLAEIWDGSSWTVSLPQNVATGDYLYGVSCVSTTYCVAVGEAKSGQTSQRQTLAETWSGGSWSVVTSANSATNVVNVLSGVSCTSTTYCIAVGYQHPNSGFIQVIGEKWDGTAFTMVTVPSMSATNNPQGVSCATSSFCAGAGYYDSGGGVDKTLVEHWDGTQFNSVTSQNNGASTEYNSLGGVSCVSATFCMGVGYHASGAAATGHTLGETWNGTAPWTLVTTPDTSATTPDYLEAVSCTSTTFCLAAGITNPGSNATLYELWDGSAWTILASPNSGINDNLYGTSCVDQSGAKFCMSVGWYTNSSSVIQTLTQEYTASAPPPPGTWSGAAGTGSSYLHGISCPSTTLCFAVGRQYNGSIDVNFIEKWNGTSWSVMSGIPNNAQSKFWNELDGVGCYSTTLCYAVGDAYNPSSGPLYEAILQWNGTSWTNISPASVAGPLARVACADSTHCWAVGNSLIQQIVPPPGTMPAPITAPGPAPVGLTGIACPGATTCYAAGESGTSPNFRALIDKWDGTSWTNVSGITYLGSGQNQLWSITCNSTVSCVAAGDYNGASQVIPLAEWFDGSTWTADGNTQSTAAAPVPLVNVLNGIACPTTSTCVGVGDYNAVAPNVFWPFGVQWGAGTWTQDLPPQVGNVGQETLSDIACPTTTTCFAVGYEDTGGVQGVLIETWAG